MLPENIIVSTDPAADLSKAIATLQPSKIAVLVDQNTRANCYPVISDSLPAHTLIEIIAGEEEKHLGSCQKIWEAMTEEAFDRKALLVNLGGGVIGDMGGFCAASYKRGIHFINLPTTLLSQVDASVGGKLGIDFQGYKNHIGFFQEPNSVIIWPGFLKTLPQREVRSGFAEVIKHCLIADGSYWDMVSSKGLDGQPWQEIIPRSVGTKYKVVQEDPTEKGLRKILNFGHTIGHAVESFFLDRGDNRLFHGEAIAIGMIAEGYLSVKKTGLAEADFKVFAQYIREVYDDYAIDTADIRAIAQLSLQDKKNSGGTINASLLDGLGSCAYDIPITLQEIEEALRYYLKK